MVSCMCDGETLGKNKDKQVLVRELSTLVQIISSLLNFPVR